MSIALQCLGLVLLASAETRPWDAVQAFRPEAETSGVWSYGYTVPGKQPFTFYNTGGTSSEGFACRWADNWTTVGGVIAKSPDAGPRAIHYFQFVPNWLLLHPGPQDQKATLRFTAPAKGPVLLLDRRRSSFATTEKRTPSTDWWLFPKPPARGNCESTSACLTP